MQRKFFNRNNDPSKHHDRLELAEVLGASVGAFAFGAAGVVALTELITEQPEQLLVAGTLSVIAIGGFVLATTASIKLPISESISQADAQPETQSAPTRSD